MYKYYSEQLLKTTLEKAWRFFSSPENLSAITPPALDFFVLTKLTGEEIYPGMKIDYRVRPLLGVPVRWTTEIGSVKRLEYFTDKQARGPYKVWEHTHYFKEQDGGVMMQDVIKYQLPMGFLGKLAHPVVVKKLDNIFGYRREVLEKMFNS